MQHPRLTHPTTVVLYAVAAGHVYGFDIIDVTGLGSGTVYPILRRLETAGLLRGSAEAAHKAWDAGRPPRRYYAVTRAGADALAVALDRHPSAALLIGARAAALRPDPA